MKKLTLIILVSLSIIIFAATIVMAGVTEIKIYTSEHPSRWAKVCDVYENFAERTELEGAANEMWSRLPSSYQWLKDWKYV
jgi:hypothetical protein